MQLRGRHLWLIGASSGIGAALAPRLAGEGAILALSARREEELREVAERSFLHGARPLIKPLDVLDADGMRRVYSELKQAWGQVDVLFYNAGTWSEAKVDVFDAERAVRQLEVNLGAMMRAVGLFLPDVLARGEGDIVGMASIAGYAGLPRASAYSATKAGANAFLQALRIELKPRDIGVTTINPGFVKTELTDRNRFAMPFIISADAAAKVIVRGMLAGDAEIHFPKRLSWPLKLMTGLPRPVFERLAAIVMMGKG